jgi:septal ring factor EnvC (AmiA/AmiB activator)
MARRSLRPHLNQIRTWVQQGRTDAWIAHQLEVTVQQIDAFKRENELTPDAQVEGNGTPADFDDEIDLRAQDDELIAAELEKAEAERAAREAEEAEAAAAEAARRAEAGEDEDEDDGEPKPAARRRGRRGTGRTRGAARARRSRAPSTTGTRATACGWTPQSRTTRCTPSTGRATAPCPSRSRRTRS